ncbi:hypothetical protein TNCV_2388181 [Trichonephila clavipes]|nr:hypothetical protein TNCV_2388181 [Trichonephila clavipes]
MEIGFTKLALNSNNTSASEAKLSTFDSFDVPEPEFMVLQGIELLISSFDGNYFNLVLSGMLCNWIETGRKILRKDLAPNLCVWLAVIIGSS